MEVLRMEYLLQTYIIDNIQHMFGKITKLFAIRLTFWIYTYIVCNELERLNVIYLKKLAIYLSIWRITMKEHTNNQRWRKYWIYTYVFRLNLIFLIRDMLLIEFSSLVFFFNLWQLHLCVCDTLCVLLLLCCYF